jgi:hypothetical protein
MGQVRFLRDAPHTEIGQDVFPDAEIAELPHECIAGDLGADRDANPRTP